jgi:hypothetical protein
MLSAREYYEHCKAESISTLAADPRLSYGSMALASVLSILVLAWPGELLEEHGFEILQRWVKKDYVLMLLFAIHAWGMLRSIFKIVERPQLDSWITALGFALFGACALTVDISLGRVTLLSATVTAVAINAGWLMVSRNRKSAGVTVR